MKLTAILLVFVLASTTLFAVTYAASPFAPNKAYRFFVDDSGEYSLIIDSVPTVYTIGDSITSRGAYQPHLDTLLGSQSASHNVAVSGYSCDAVLEQYAANVTNGSDITVVSLCGINDLARGVGASVIEERIARIYDLSVQKNNSLVLNAITPANDRQANCGSILSINKWLASFAATHMTNGHPVPLIDSYHAVWNGTDCYINSEYSDDGGHPNDAGGRALAQAIWAQGFGYANKSTVTLPLRFFYAR